MSKTRRFLGSMVLILAAAAGPAAAQSALKLGVFDPQRVSDETAEGKRVQADLAAFQQKKQQELRSMQTEVEEMRKQLSGQALSLSAEKRAEIEKSIQKKILDLQSAEESANRQFQLEITNAQKRFEGQLRQVVEGFGREEGFTLILDAATVVWASEGIDVTTAIVDRFNKAVPAAPPAAPAAKP